MFKLVLYNIIKHRFLFILIGIMVFLFCVYLLLGLNVLNSVSRSLAEAVSSNLSGDLIIASKDARNIDLITKEGETEIIELNRWEELLRFLRDDGNVAVAAPRLRVWALIKSEDNTKPMILTGVDPSVEPDLLPGRKLYEGRWIENHNEIAMYYRHSDALNANVNTLLGISINTLKLYPNFDTGPLVGILDYDDLAMYSEFAFQCFVSLDFLNELLLSEKKIAGEIFVRLRDGAAADRVVEAVRNEFGDAYKFVHPQDSAALIQGIHRLTFFTITFIGLILLVMVYLSSSFLVNVSIETRRSEIGVYLAMGVKKWRIGLMLGSEFLIVLAAFGIIGIVFGSWLMREISMHGIEASIVPLRLIFGRSILYVESYAQTYAVIAVLLFTAFIFNAVNASLKLGKLNPVLVMREL